VADLIVYPGWRTVPAGLYSKTQLADLDLPRVPGGPQRAWVETSNWRGKKDHFELYRLSESVPSPATAAQLQAARARSFGSDHTGGRVCGECGARPDRPVPELGAVTGSAHLPDGDAEPTRRLCLACARVVRLRAAVAAAARTRTEAARWAARVLAAAPPVVRVDEVFRPPAPSGRRNLEPVALCVDAVTAISGRRVQATIRLAGPRVKAVPPDAVDPGSLAEVLRPLLAAEMVVTWRREELRPLLRLYYADALTWPRGGHNSLWERATWWRGEVDPDTLVVRHAIDPGTAERTLLLLRRMAATAPPNKAVTKW